MTMEPRTAADPQFPGIGSGIAAGMPSGVAR